MHYRHTRTKKLKYDFKQYRKLKSGNQDKTKAYF